MLALLFLQFALGMWVNLYASIPQLAPGYGMMGIMFAVMYSASAPVLMLHMMLGWLMAAGALVVFVLSLLHGKSSVIDLSAVGLVSVLLAGLGGMYFLFSGGNNAYSYLMALAFVSAFSAYFSALAYTG
ncbi:MAG: hypothetical protein JRN08_04335 [Nitrososphaerota archaeon]|nr:hypothetical protein [Nitrososphaerota archaeon]